MFKAQWTNTNRNTIYLSIDGAWDEDDFNNAEDAVSKMFREVIHRVSLVLHVENPQPIPMRSLESLKTFLSVQAPNMDKMVVVVPDEMLSGVSAVVQRLFDGQVPSYIAFANTVNHAEEQLTEA